ncbi:MULTISPECIES: hypothetical protein [unclassified Acinetobacter]|uniref:hypothetical protein n=1 Tax=unclassified Acinetobacter TaxID=196816 RepID=UPI0015D45023|nr:MULTISPECIES: hypothetical protein [unclassified Acinetobacter]
MNNTVDINIDVLEEEVKSLVDEPIPANIILEKYQNTFLTPLETLETSSFAKFVSSQKLNYTLNKESSDVTLSDHFFTSAILFTPEEKGIYELTYTNIFGKKRTIVVDSVDKQGRVTFWLNDIVSKFNLKINNSKWLGRKRVNLTEFKIWGLDFSEFTNQIKKLNQITNDRSEYEGKIENLKNELTKNINILKNKFDEYQNFLDENASYESELIENISTLKVNRDSLQKNIDQLNIEITSLDSQLSAKQNQLSKLENDFNELSKKSKLLSDGNVRLEKRQQELEKKVNTFTDTLEGFNDRANRTKLTYGALSIIPMIILSFLIILSWDTLKTFSQSTALATFESAWIVLIQRIPFTLLVITLASMCIAFIYKMVRHLTEVQQQELNLAKISMLAKDVADSVYSNLPESALQKIRAEKKLVLIREFMNSEYIRYQQFIEKEKNLSNKTIKFIPFNGILKNYVPFLKNIDSNPADK